MSRDYSAVSKTKTGFRRLTRKEWHVNMWSVRFFGRLFEYWGLPVYKDERFTANIPQLDFFYGGNRFKAIVEKLSNLTDEQIEEGVSHVYKETYPDLDMDLPGWIECFREEIIPLFQQTKAVGIVEDGTELTEKDVKLELEGIQKETEDWAEGPKLLCKGQKVKDEYGVIHELETAIIYSGKSYCCAKFDVAERVENEELTCKTCIQVKNIIISEQR